MKHLVFTLLILTILSPALLANNPFITPTQAREQIIQKKGLLQSLVDLQKKLNRKTSNTIKKIKEGNSLRNYLIILGVLFLYGAVHAAGPGHGKGIIASWVLGSSRKLKQILRTAAVSELLHALSSVLIIIGTYTILKKTVSISSVKLQEYLQILASVIILAIGCYAIIRFSFKSGHSHLPQKEIKPLFITFSIGLVPCPIASVIFIFSLSYGLVWQGVLFVLIFSMGMITTLLLIGYLCWLLRQRVSNFRDHKLFRHLENYLPLISALLFISMGLFLLLPYILRD